MNDTTTITWRKARSCHANGTCVELARRPDGVAVRDAKHPTGPQLRVSRATLRHLKDAA
jgi:hypothetical protein